MVDTPQHPVAAQIMSRFVQRTIRSKQYDARAKERLPGGDTRAATYFSPYPAYMMSGNGCYLFDVDGNKYLDLLNNYTSLIHGHAHPEIIVAANAQLKNGTVFGAASEIQFQHAEHLCDRIRSMDQVRYCNSGTEATLFAIRAARAFTGRDIFIKMDGGYHGCHDAVEVNIFADPNSADATIKHIGPGVSAGVLEDVRIVPFNDLDAVEVVHRAHPVRVSPGEPFEHLRRRAVVASEVQLRRAGEPGVDRLPYSLKVLLENLLQLERGDLQQLERLLQMPFVFYRMGKVADWADHKHYFRESLAYSKGLCKGILSRIQVATCPGNKPLNSCAISGNPIVLG